MRIQESEVEHIDFLETQIALIEKVGEQNYIQTQVGTEPNEEPNG